MSFKNFGLFFLLLLILTLVAFFYLGRPVYGIDDANIFFTYARNLVHGEGFVFNHGGERVEGFTSLLWVLICTVFFAFTSHPELILLVFLFLLTVATVTIVYNEVKKDVAQLHPLFAEKYFLPAYCLFLISIAPSYLAWSVLSLMENGLWNFFFAVITVLLLHAYGEKDFSTRNRLALVCFSLLLLLTRPEGLAWGLFFTLLLAVAQFRNKRGQGFTVLYFLLMAALSLGFTYFRYQYFGYPFPNTYYAKVSHDLLYNIKNGGAYALVFIVSFHPVISVILAVLAAASLSSWKSFTFLRNPDPVELVRQRITIVSFIILISLLLPLSTGGDHFGGFRFYQAILVLFAWGIPAMIWLIKKSRNMHGNISTLRTTLVFSTLILMAGAFYGVKGPSRNQFNYEFFLAMNGRKEATEFNKIWDGQYPSVGVVAVGGFSLKYKGETIDLMGLNNTLMGHSKGDRTGIKNHAAFNKEVFYQLHPDIVLPQQLKNKNEAALTYASFLNQYNFENQAMKNIFNDADFYTKYQPVVIEKKSLGQSYFSFCSTGFLDKMKSDSSIAIELIKL